MPLDLPPGARCFIDANIFYYHVIHTPPFSEPCSDLLQRVFDSDVVGFTSTHALAEAVHKVMLAEAASRFGRPRAGILGWLQGHPDRIAQLTDFDELATEFASMNLVVSEVELTRLSEGARLSRQTGLFTNDALIVAVMRREGLSHLVTNDDDFDGVPGLTVWKPR